MALAYYQWRLQNGFHRFVEHGQNIHNPTIVINRNLMVAKVLPFTLVKGLHMAHRTSEREVY